MDKIKILLADDHAILREGLRALLNHYDDIEIIGEAQDGFEVVDIVEQLRPDVVLMDIAMPGMGGLEASRIICQKYPETKVLVLTQYDDFEYVQSLIHAGASGYVTKRAMGTDLITALHVIIQGDTFFQPSVASIVADQIRKKSIFQSDFEDKLVEPLSSRELEILKYIALGNTNRQIAVLLNLSVKTIGFHRTNLMSKLDIHNVADLVRYAMEHGLLKKD